MKMNKKDLFALMGKLDDRYIAASAYIAEGGEDIVCERPVRRRAAAFFQSGWFVAILCAVVSLSVVGAMVWAGRQEPGVVPPIGATEQESGLDSLHEDVHIEKETDIEVIEKQKVVISTVNCLGQPYKVSFYLPYQYNGGIVFTSNITLEDSSHYIESLITPPTVDQLTFNSSEYIISLYREYIDSAIIHVGFNDVEYACKACQKEVKKPIFIDGDEVTVITRTCTGQNCNITYVISRSLHQITDDNHDGYPSGMPFILYYAYFSLPNNTSAIFADSIITHQVIVSFPSREHALDYANKLVASVVHVQYDKEHRLCTACGQLVGDKKDLPAIDSVQSIKISYCGNKDKTLTVTDPTVISNILTFISEAGGEMGESTMGHYGTVFRIEIVDKDGKTSYTFNLWDSKRYSIPQYKDADGYEYFFDADMSEMYEYLNEKYPVEFWYPNGTT